MGKRKDLTGQRFGKWTVLEESRTDSGTRGWLCKCDSTISHRLQSGWSVEKALTKPIQKQNRMQ